MTVKERAFDIFSKLNDRQLEGFVAMFGAFFAESEGNHDDGLEERTRAFNEINLLRRSIPDLDEDKELEEYRKEKYGK